VARPSPHLDWLDALRRPAPGLTEEATRRGPALCTRCRRPAHSLESWLERRRVRTPQPGAPGGFSYAHQIREHLLCGPCYLEVRNGRPTVRHDGLKILALALAGAVALAAALPFAMPYLLAAYWHTGALPTGWHEGRRTGRSAFIQGRF
jgi:hypothetical protein